MKHQIVRNSEGKELTLNALEQRVADYNQRIVNELPLGFDVNITTLTTVIKRVTEQKFFTIAPADYLPLRVGEGAWSDQLTTYRSFQLGNNFADGILNSGADSSRLSSTDAGVDSVTVPVRNWAKSIGWSLFDLQQAAKSGNWDLVSAKEKARKKNWDLGIQSVAFLGLPATGSLGLLNQATSGPAPVTLNTTLIAQSLSSLDPADYSVFIAQLIQLFRQNCAYTAYPTHFIVPEDDFNGLAQPSSPQFPMISKLQLLLDACRIVTGNKDFKILPLAYSIVANSLGILSHERYVLLNYDEESIRMDIPVDYTSTLANSVNNFTFQNVGYGQFTGVGLYRNLEIMYFDNLSA